MDNLIFLDRDGVINWDPIGDYIKRVEDFRFLDGVIESLLKLKENDFEIVIISNQAGIGDGIYPKENLDEITEYMLDELEKKGIEIAGVYYCLHGKKEGCGCRKPEMGLFEEAAKHHSFDTATTFFVGDKNSDTVAGKRYHLRTILVRTGHGTNEEKIMTPDQKPDFIVNDIREAVDVVIRETKD